MRSEIKLRFIQGSSSRSTVIPVDPTPIKVADAEHPSVLLVFADGDGVVFTAEDAKRIGEALVEITR